MTTQNWSVLSLATRRVDAELERLRLLQEREAELEAESGRLTKDVEAAEQALALAQVTAEETQRELALELTGLANEAVRCLFPKYTFEAEAVHRAGRMEVEFSLVDKAGNRTSPLLSNGGGVVDLLAFALRVVGIKLAGASPLVVLDEPFRFLSSAMGLRAKAGELLSQLRSELEADFLIVSHDPELVSQADELVEL